MLISRTQKAITIFEDMYTHKIIMEGTYCEIAIYNRVVFADFLVDKAVVNLVHNNIFSSDLLL